jgi:6-methylpretetramide 4-monooxygenase / 4-hydroxy-6-methylpretetramide 12a-monooxygenase
VVDGRATEALLDSYQAERQPVSATVLRSTELATRAVTVTAAAPRALRHSAVRLLSRVRPFQQQVGRTMGQLTVDYPDSPLTVERWNGPDGGPAAGDRAPDTHLRAAAGLTTLRRLTADTGHHVLVFAGDAPAGPELDALADRWRAAVGPAAGVLVVSRRPRRDGADPAVVEDRSGRAHRAYGAGAGTVHLLRPDGYVAYRRHHDVEPAEVARLLRAYAPEPAAVG